MKREAVCYLDDNTASKASPERSFFPAELAINRESKIGTSGDGFPSRGIPDRLPSECRLFHFYGSPSISELLPYGLRFFLGDTLFHCFWRAIHQVLGFLQAQAGDFAYRLDYIDLIGANVLQNDAELGLLFRRSRCCCSTAPSHHHRGRSRR